MMGAHVYRRRPGCNTRDEVFRRLIEFTHKSKECFVWNGPNNGSGYGQVTYKGVRLSTHVLAFRMFVGPIPRGKEVDHVCRNPACWRPSHLEAVPHQINMKRMWAVVRKTCKYGHNEWGLDNRGARRCLECDRNRHRVSKISKAA